MFVSGPVGSEACVWCPSCDRGSAVARSTGRFLNRLIASFGAYWPFLCACRVVEARGESAVGSHAGSLSPLRAEEVHHVLVAAKEETRGPDDAPGFLPRTLSASPCARLAIAEE